MSTEYEKLREKVARSISMRAHGYESEWPIYVPDAEAAMSTIYADLRRVNALPGESLHTYILRALSTSPLNGGRDE